MYILQDTISCQTIARPHSRIEQPSRTSVRPRIASDTRATVERKMNLDLAKYRHHIRRYALSGSHFVGERNRDTVDWPLSLPLSTTIRGHTQPFSAGNITSSRLIPSGTPTTQCHERTKKVFSASRIRIRRLASVNKPRLSTPMVPPAPLQTSSNRVTWHRDSFVEPAYIGQPPDQQSSHKSIYFRVHRTQSL